MCYCKCMTSHVEALYPADPRDGLTTQEAARYLGTSEQMIRRYCRNDVIQYAKVKEPDKAEPIYLIPMGELHKLAFRKRRGVKRTRYVMPSGKVAFGTSLPPMK